MSFEYKTLEQISAMSEEEQKAYSVAQIEHTKKLQEKTELAIKELQEKQADKALIEGFEEQLKKYKSEIERLSLDVKAIAENPINTIERKTLRALIEEHSETIKAIKSDKGGSKPLNFEVTKATMNASDIDSGEDFATMLPGVFRKPVRRTRILDKFRRRPISTEYIKYLEQDVVTRDAKFVVACAPSTHNTKLTWKVRQLTLAKVRDFVNVCIDMLADYDFVYGEIYNLLNESLDLKIEQELLLGASTDPEDLLSIDSISSEFNPANPLADFTNSFAFANLEQLVDSMQAQIAIFGQLNAWQADTVIMNYADFIKYRNLKDEMGNKIIHTVAENTQSGLETRYYIAGLEVLTSPIVSQNTLYVFDSTKGVFFDRMRKEVNIAYENREFFEQEIATIKAVQRLQFHVATIDRDAFMKCSDVAAAIAAITSTPS